MFPWPSRSTRMIDPNIRSSSPSSTPMVRSGLSVTDGAWAEAGVVPIAVCDGTKKLMRRQAAKQAALRSSFFFFMSPLHIAGRTG
jgi:hypothetical protein